VTEPVTETAPVDYAASLIISVYKDTEALRLILASLPPRADAPLEIIVSEDGSDPGMAACVAELRRQRPDIAHLTQDDQGFRKNRALNRAVAAARSDYLIFIDGDCLPHRRFVQRHLACAEPGCVCVGRRVELGPWFSNLLRRRAWARRLIQRQWFYPLLALPMALDKVKNYETGLSSTLLNRANRNKQPGILGSNFSCHRGDLIKVNGFNEAFLRAGIGEDSDVDWRLRAAGMRFKNLKFAAIQYHLYHGGPHAQSEENLRLMHEAKARNEIYCVRGIDQYLKHIANRSQA